MKLYSETEMRINKIMNFLNEKDEAGESVENPEDEKHLLDEISNLEEQSLKLEISITEYSIKSNIIRQSFKRVIEKALSVKIKMIDCYILSKQIVDKYFKNKHLDLIDKQLEKHYNEKSRT